jgi:uncharacterized membrane protein HdeD (DUF308 family)
MDSTSVVLASVIGLVALGDQIAAGRAWWVVLGLALVVLGVLAMAAAAGLRAERVAVPVPAAAEGVA